ncbi:MAG: hypothetical protein ACOC5T_08700 [Elusimicrobiota bacterium]
MAFTGTLTTEEEIDFFAGANASPSVTEANKNTLTAQAEAYLNVLGKYDFVSNYASLNDEQKQILSEYCARLAAIGIISYDMSTYTSRIEAEDMINIHWARLNKIEEKIREQNFVKQITDN